MMTKGATVSEPELEKKYTEQNVWPQCLDELSDDPTQMKYIKKKTESTEKHDIDSSTHPPAHR